MNQTSKDHLLTMEGVPTLPPEMHNQELIRKIVREELKKIFDAVPKLRESEPVYESIEDKLAHRVTGVRSIPGANMCNELLQSIKDTISNQESEL